MKLSSELEKKIQAEIQAKIKERLADVDVDNVEIGIVVSVQIEGIIDLS